jgi:hypothetical protein
MSGVGGRVGVKLRAVTPSDSTVVNCQALWVGGAGNVAILAESDADDAGSAVTIVGVAAGTLLPIAADRVMSTNTTATSIVAIYI